MNSNRSVDFTSVMAKSPGLGLDNLVGDHTGSGI